jgi:hypothetical protein
MRKIETVFVGRLEASIAELSRVPGRLLSRYQFVLVTSIDSETNMSLVRWARRLLDSDPSSHMVGEGVLTSGEGMEMTLREENPFTGFDEVWGFERSPQVPKPIGASVVAPLDLTVEDPSNALVRWFIESDCLVGLADGYGTNYVTTLESLATELEAAASILERE